MKWVIRSSERKRVTECLTWMKPKNELPQSILCHFFGSFFGHHWNKAWLLVVNFFPLIFIIRLMLQRSNCTDLVVGYSLKVLCCASPPPTVIWYRLKMISIERGKFHPSHCFAFPLIRGRVDSCGRFLFVTSQTADFPGASIHTAQDSESLFPE